MGCKLHSILICYGEAKRGVFMKKDREKVTTSIDRGLVKELDRKIIDSKHFKNRSDFFEFFLMLLPYVSEETTTDIGDFIQQLCEKTNKPTVNRKENQVSQPTNDDSVKLALKGAKNMFIKNMEADKQ